MPEIPKYNGTTDPNEYVTSYSCAIKGNELEDDETESVLLKKIGETLSKGEMILYHNLPPNSIDSFAMLADSFVKEHAGAIKAVTRKSDLFKVRQKDNEILREFVSRFQMERMDLSPVTNDWAVQPFTQGLNERSSSKIRVEDDQLGAPSGSVYPNRSKGRIQRDIEREPRSNRDRYQPYSADHRNSGPGRNPVRNDRVQNSRGLMSKTGFDKHVEPKEAPQLSEYNFSVDASGIVSAIGRIKDTRWPRTLQSDLTQRNPNQIFKYHGTHGHKIEDCRQLREEVARLFNEGHLREFLSDRAKNHFRDRDANRRNHST
ncbi:PREDICTED: uncharacterized protein LOC109235973 [Nicotiana attenuata]|uniref:uncharacterized protein LOC109235973 n=1 Tax=Nicotiana attenuata TaxID=49451 RepID=UPI0009051320|nr:PREDICTED: uncharacterized protein LOC109235973 [Nicotiana attenuata]